MKEKVIEQFASCAAWKQWTNKLVKFRIPFQTAFSSHGLWPHEERCHNKINFPVPNNRMEWHTQKLFMASKSLAWTCHLFPWALLICNQHTSISFLRLVMWNKKRGRQCCSKGIPILLMQADTNLCTWCLRASQPHAYTSLKHQRGKSQIDEINASIVRKPWQCIMLVYDTFWNFETFGEGTWALTQAQFQSFKRVGCWTQHAEWTIQGCLRICIQKFICMGTMDGDDMRPN